jgi:RNA polymerase sigma factor (TIGR02999 family)
MKTSSKTADAVARELTIAGLLRQLAEGDEAAGEQLLPLVYDELYGLARHFMARERTHHTLQATALVHEAWIRLSNDATPHWQNREQFIGVAARAMRRVLVDHARRRDARKRSGAAERLPFEALLELYEESGPPMVELDEALSKLAAVDPQLVRIVEQRFFFGASNDDIARALNVSTRTVERGWKTAQAWLRAELGEAAAPDA